MIFGDRMDTKLFSINPNEMDREALHKAGQIIKDGGLVAFPTETVYGLGGDALNKQSSQKIYAVGRRRENLRRRGEVVRLEGRTAALA